MQLLCVRSHLLENNSTRSLPASNHKFRPSVGGIHIPGAYRWCRCILFQPFFAVRIGKMAFYITQTILADSVIVSLPASHIVLPSEDGSSFGDVMCFTTKASQLPSRAASYC
jgi:hypothetical protein